MSHFKFPDPNDPSVHIVDLESGGLPSNRAQNFSLREFLEASAPDKDFLSHPMGTFNRNVPILQIYSTNHPAYKLSSSHNSPISSYVKPSPGYRSRGRFISTPIGAWAEENEIGKRSRKFGHWDEEEALGHLFRGWENSLASNKSITLAGWNLGYDLNLIESGVRRYQGLSKYHGWMSRMHGEGRLAAVDMQDALFDVVHAFGKANPAFAESHLRMRPSGKIAESAAELRNVPGWSLERVISSMGGSESLTGIQAKFHDAFIDVRGEQAVYTSWMQAHARLEEGATDFRDILSTVMLGHEKDPEKFLSGLYDTSWRRNFATAAETGVHIPRVATVKEIPRGSYGKLAIAGAAISVAAISYGLAYGKRKDRQTQIEGLRHDGLGSRLRHFFTPFGSGWKGIDDQNPDYRTARYLTAAGSLYGAHLLAHRKFPQYGQKVYNGLRTLERKSPWNAFRFFRGSQLASSYVHPDVELSSEMLLRSRNSLSELGLHLERLLGKDADILGRAQQGSLRFTREKGSAYTRMAGTDYFVRFGESGKNAGLAGSSFRFGRPHAGPGFTAPPVSGNWKKQWHDRTENRRRSQTPYEGPRSFKDEAGNWKGGTGFHTPEFEGEFRPIFGYQKGKYWEAARQKVGVTALDLVERPQRLLSHIGLGLGNREWNTAGSLIKGLLVKRVLPAYLGYEALRWVDSKLGHKPSETLASVPLKAQLVRAELTDHVSGARKVTDWYKDHVGGAQYGPLALPLAGYTVASLIHYGKVLGSSAPEVTALEGGFKNLVRSKWTLAGAALALPFLPGMLGSRKSADKLRREFSGEDPVPVRSGRWWFLGSTPLAGNRISYYRPHWFALLKARPEQASIYGSDAEQNRHNPLFHPLRWLKDPYYLEKKHAEDRPYPITSPAFSNVPLVGPLLATTLGKLIKPVHRMHEDQWDGKDYTLFNSRIEPRGPDALPVAPVKEEYSLKDVVGRQGEIAAEFVGMPGFLAKTLRGQMVDTTKNQGKDVYLEGSRQMTNLSRRYYERELGAGLGVSPGLSEITEYSEPWRRFVQREPKRLLANEIRNTMPSWLPGADYMTNFRKGDAYARIPFGAARLPGAGYNALHPELKGVDPENYSSLEKLRILADVAPYSNQYSQWRSIVGRDVENNPADKVEYEQILARVKEQRESSINTTEQRFTAPVDTINGTVKSVSLRGVELNEMPDQIFSFSALGMSGADLAALSLGANNKLTRDQAAREGLSRQERAGEYLGSNLKAGSKVRLIVPEGAAANGNGSKAVIFADGKNINRELLDKGLASSRADESGAEYQAMNGTLGNLVGRLGEEASGLNKGVLNPLRYLPTPHHSKLWQQRTALNQYLAQEVYGTRLQRWEHPIQKFVKPYFRGMANRLTGRVIVPEQVKENRDLNTLTDQLRYLRALESDNSQGSSRTSIGANQLGNPVYLKSTIQDREKYYYQSFIEETDPDKRQQILASVSPELARTLETQWAAVDARNRRAKGKKIPEIGEGGRLKVSSEYKDFEEARGKKETELDFGDWERSKEVADFFFRKDLRLPDNADSAVYNPDVDYEDVKLKIIEEEGYDYHDFNMFDDRASLLWRKPYVDGAVRELTSGNRQTATELRQKVEKMIIASHDRNPRVSAIVEPSRKDRTNIKIRVKEEPDAAIMRDIRRNSAEYDEQDQAE